MKSRTLKILAITAGIIFAVIIALIILALMALPSAREIGKALKSQKPSAQTTTAKSSTDKAETTSSTVSGEISSVADSEQDKNQDVQLKKEQLLDNLSDDTKPLSSVCEHITKIDQIQNTEITGKEFGKRFELSLEQKSSDPLIESFSSILKFTFTRPTLKELMNEIKNTDLKKEDSDSLMQKASFYNKAMKAYRELVSSRSQMEKIVDQSYLLMMLGRAVEAKPELRTDARIQDYCEQIEAGLNNNQFPDFAKSKAAFSDFLNESGIDPKSIGFDSNYKTELIYDIGAKGLHFSGGWLDTVFAKPAAKN